MKLYHIGYVCFLFWRLKHNIGKWVRQKSLFCKQFTGNNYWSSPTEQLNDLRSFFLPIFHSSSSLSGCPQLNHGGRSLSWAIVKNQGRYSRHSQKDVCKNWARWQYWQEFLACFLIGSGTIWSFTLFMGTHINKSIAEEGSSKMSKLYNTYSNFQRLNFHHFIERRKLNSVEREAEWDCNILLLCHWVLLLCFVNWLEQSDHFSLKKLCWF